MTPRDRLHQMIVTFGWTGLFPIVPGTVGSAAAVALAAALHYWGALSFWVLIGMTIGAGALNVILGPWINEKMGKDPRPVVIDEAAGQWISCLPILFITGTPWGWFVAAFFLFRLFDITKPLGIKWWERFPQGWGILLDDCVAGCYVALLLTGAAWWMELLSLPN
ncbi:MAG: phosphatidylglycerophosphatase A [Planctomycetota bacterium]